MPIGRRLRQFTHPPGSSRAFCELVGISTLTDKTIDCFAGAQLLWHRPCGKRVDDPRGRNGPPVRCASHWMILYGKRTCSNDSSQFESASTGCGFEIFAIEIFERLPILS